MSTDQAIGLLTAHRNGLAEFSYEDRKQALATIGHLVTEWIQRVDGVWQLVVIGYHK